MISLPATETPVTLNLPELNLPLPSSAAESDRACVFTSEELLQGRREAWIEHRGELYRLRLTGSGKLYLTK